MKYIEVRFTLCGSLVEVFLQAWYMFNVLINEK
jgi:hypothetical protein